MAEAEFWRECVLQMYEDGAKPPNFNRLQERLSTQYSNPRSIANKLNMMLKKTGSEAGPATPKTTRSVKKTSESPKKRSQSLSTSPKCPRRKLTYSDGKDAEELQSSTSEVSVTKDITTSA